MPTTGTLAVRFRPETKSRVGLLAGAALLALLAPGCQRTRPAPPRPTASAAPRSDARPGGLVRFRGTLVYMADAAVLTECRTGRAFPVAMEADYLALERASLAARRAPGAPLLVTLEGHLVTRVPEAGAAPREVLVVDRFERTLPGESCEARSRARLESTYWRAIEIDGTPAVVRAHGQEPHVVLDPDGRVRGSGGCNRIVGRWERRDGGLRIGKLGATRMACPEGMAQEQAFLAALERATSYRIEGERLELRAGEVVVVRLEAR